MDADQKPQRKAVSARLRFEVFRRDGFRCVYCGATPMQKVLRADHVVPVAEGGPSTAANLVTACHDCNAGKGKEPLEAGTLESTADALEAKKDHLKQIRSFLRIEREIEGERRKAIDDLTAYWQEFVGPLSKDMHARFPGLLRFWPSDKLREAVDIVARKMGTPAVTFNSDNALGQAKYFHGIIRRWRAAAGEKP